MHIFPQLSYNVRLKGGVYSARAQTDKHHLVNRGTGYTAVPRGVADLYLL